MGGAKPSVRVAPYTLRQDPKAAVFCALPRFLRSAVKGELSRAYSFFRGFRHSHKPIHQLGVS